jgi:hypothetical protein
VTTAKTLTVTAGLAGALALGVWAVPRVMDDDERATDRMVSEISEPAPADRAAAKPRAARRAPAAPKVAALPATTPELHDRLKPVLNRGTKMALAADGFRSAEQFATVAHLARNTEVPFVVLKHRVLEEGKSLAAAVRESKPDVNAAAEVRRARAAAREDVKALAGDARSLVG